MTTHGNAEMQEIADIVSLIWPEFTNGRLPFLPYAAEARSL